MHEAEMLWKHAVGVSKGRKASWRKDGRSSYLEK